MEEIAENNKLIAEFMEVPIFKDSQEELYDIGNTGKIIYALRPNSLCYNKSWNWLMPVVEKIESLDLKEWFYKWEDDGINYNFQNLEVEIYYNRCSIYVNLELDPSYDLAYSKAETKIEATYQTVVEFIKWYNEKKKENDSTGI